MAVLWKAWMQKTCLKQIIVDQVIQSVTFLSPSWRCHSAIESVTFSHPTKLTKSCYNLGPAKTLENHEVTMKVKNGFPDHRLLKIQGFGNSQGQTKLVRHQT